MNEDLNTNFKHVPMGAVRFHKFRASRLLLTFETRCWPVLQEYLLLGIYSIQVGKDPTKARADSMVPLEK